MREYTGWITCYGCDDLDGVSVEVEGLMFDDGLGFYGKCPNCQSDLEGDVLDDTDPDRYNELAYWDAHDD